MHENQYLDTPSDHEAKSLYLSVNRKGQTKLKPPPPSENGECLQAWVVCTVYRLV